VASGVQATAVYLRTHKSDEVANDLMEVLRRHPFRSLLLALAAGYLLGRIHR
jgi:hypothetical protein